METGNGSSLIWPFSPLPPEFFVFFFFALAGDTDRRAASCPPSLSQDPIGSDAEADLPSLLTPSNTSNAGTLGLQSDLRFEGGTGVGAMFGSSHTF